MRIVENFATSLRELERYPSQEDPNLPSHVLDRLATIFGEAISATEAVWRIIADIRLHGDQAILDYTKRIDGTELVNLDIPSDTWASASVNLNETLREALSLSSSRIFDFHQACLPKDWFDGNLGVGLKHVPIERVGIYIPGGTATYPSTVLMSAIPARVAGVKEIILCTPNPTDSVLTAALNAKVDQVFQIGGSQAIAAMAFGSESIPRVDKIVGPGNIFVSIAKRLVYGSVDIDGLYGPTETLIIADDSVNPQIIASDLLAQAEHDDLATPILITFSRAIANLVNDHIEEQSANMPRESIIKNSLANQGAIHLVSDVSEAIKLSNVFAPEHLSLLIRDAEKYIPQIENAGGIFVGENSPEVLGDYVIGPSHVMPTGGTARFASNLGINSFLKQIPIMNLSSSTMLQLAPAAVEIAGIEGLSAHSASAAIRIEGIESTSDEKGQSS